MIKIAETKVLLRAAPCMPLGFKVATEEFRNGWCLMKSGGTQRLANKVRSLGWHMVRLAEVDLRSGVGKTGPDAVANALSLALRRLDGRSNAVEVEAVEIVDYPWFFLARLKVVPYSVQQQAALPLDDQPSMGQLAGRHHRVPAPTQSYLPPAVGPMPMLRQVLRSGASRLAAAD
jgi:hypothetical protein